MSRDNLPALNRMSTVKQMLVKMLPKMETVLPKHIKADKMARIALTSIRKNPSLLECTPESLVAAIMECAQLGLVTDGILGHAHLIPFKDRRNERVDATVVIGYKGMIHLAMNTGRVTAVCPNVIREGDDWEYQEGDNRYLKHRPKRDNDGEPIAFYSVVLFSNGQRDFRLMWKSEVDAIRARAPGSKRHGGPWDTDYIPMGMKSAIRQHMKYLSLSPEMDRATALDEMADAGVAQGLEFGKDAIDVTPEDEQQEQLNDLKTRLKTGQDIQKEAEENEPPEPEPEESQAEKLKRTTWEMYFTTWRKETGASPDNESVLACEQVYDHARELVGEQVGSGPETQKTIKALAEHIVNGTIEVKSGEFKL